jgi:hypothetical protein
MKAERGFREPIMSATAECAEYVGALLEDEQRLVLVPMDTREPWEAFKQLRRWMISAKPAGAELALFEAPTPLESATSNVVPLDLARRRSG